MKYFAALIMALTILAFQNTGSQNQRSSSNSFITYVTSIDIPTELNFAGEKVPMNIPEVRERFERELYLLLQQPGQLALYIKRAGRYFPMFEQVLKEENLPEDFKYLSVAESALYMSRSKAGALGLWQFIEPTGKTMGLQINEYVDERMLPEKSSRAAAAYLKEGKQINGSWTLAAAGYNMGHGGVTENLRFQQVNNYYDLYLNEETSRYIFRILAIKEILQNPGKYGINLKETYKQDDVTIVEVNQSIPNLAQWAKGIGTTYKDIKLLNPWILKRELPAPSGGPWRIAAPRSSASD